MPAGLYQVPDYTGRAQQAMGGAASSFGGMMRKGPEDPGPSVGGAVQAGMGGAAMGAAASTGVAIAGAAHGGLDNVPSESTYLLNKGERVLSPNQNKDLTSFLEGGEGGGNGGVTIESVSIHVLENATNAESLLNIDSRDMEEIVADKFIDALNALDVKGVRPVFAERG